MNKHKAMSWPSTFEGSGLHLTTLAPSHAEAVWPQLQDARNMRLFQRVHNQDCSSSSALEQLIQNDLETDCGRCSYAIFKKSESELLGWTTIYNMSPDTGCMQVAFFLPARIRVPIAPRSLHLIAARAFDTLGYKQIDYRWAAMTCYKMAGGASGAFGLTLLGIIERQLFVCQDDAANVYRITDRQWRSIGPALGAWEAGSGLIGPAGEAQGMSWII